MGIIHMNIHKSSMNSHDIPMTIIHQYSINNPINIVIVQWLFSLPSGYLT